MELSKHNFGLNKTDRTMWSVFYYVIAVERSVTPQLNAYVITLCAFCADKEHTHYAVAISLQVIKLRKRLPY